MHVYASRFLRRVSRTWAAQAHLLVRYNGVAPARGVPFLSKYRSMSVQEHRDAAQTLLLRDEAGRLRGRLAVSADDGAA